jgi:3-hydroxyisobutyrate dehydrogenase
VLLEKGAHWHDSAGAAAAAADIVITMLGFPKDVEETYLGKPAASSRRQGKARS